MAVWKLKVSCDFSFYPYLFLVLGLKPSSELLGVPEMPACLLRGWG